MVPTLQARALLSGVTDAKSLNGNIHADWSQPSRPSLPNPAFPSGSSPQKRRIHLYTSESIESIRSPGLSALDPVFWYPSISMQPAKQIPVQDGRFTPASAARQAIFTQINSGMQPTKK